MVTKNRAKTIEFVDQDEGFIKKLTEDIGCHYFKANERTYNLNKFASDIHSKMGVFAWVHKEDSNCFWISTRKIWVEEAQAKAMAGRKASGINYFTRESSCQMLWKFLPASFFVNSLHLPIQASFLAVRFRL